MRLRYTLMPYIYAQAKDCTERGLPMVRALFVEYPQDPGSWLVDDEYLFGSDMLVAPLFEDVSSRDVYLPPGEWIDYQSGKVYPGGWQQIQAGPVRAVVLVREGALIPRIGLAQSTMQMDWSRLELVSFAVHGEPANGKVCLPSDNILHTIRTEGRALENDPFGGKVRWTLRGFGK